MGTSSLLLILILPVCQVHTGLLRSANGAVLVNTEDDRISLTRRKNKLSRSFCRRYLSVFVCVSNVIDFIRRP